MVVLQLELLLMWCDVELKDRPKRLKSQVVLKNNPQQTINFEDLMNNEKRPDKQVKTGSPPKKEKEKPRQISAQMYIQ